MSSPLYEEAKKAIDAVFSNKELSQEKVLHELEQLAADVQVNIDALEDDLYVTEEDELDEESDLEPDVESYDEEKE